MTNKIYRIFGTLMLAVTFQACGLKGDLYLTEEQKNPPTAGASEAETTVEM